MPEHHRYWLWEVMRSDSAFFRSMGIERCAIDDPCPKPLMLPYAGEPHLPLTKKDDLWLKVIGVAWEPEPEPELQLRLDFSGHQETVQETWISRQADMKNECSSCHGTGKCQVCRGTGEINYTNIYKELGQLGYDRYVAMEFLPTGEPVQSLRAA